MAKVAPINILEIIPDTRPVANEKHTDTSTVEPERAGQVLPDCSCLPGDRGDEVAEGEAGNLQQDVWGARSVEAIDGEAAARLTLEEADAGRSAPSRLDGGDRPRHGAEGLCEDRHQSLCSSLR